MRLEILSSVVETLPVGVVVLDQAATVVWYNRYEEALAGRLRGDTVGRNFFTEVAPCLKVAGLARSYREGVEHGVLGLEMRFRFPRPHVDRPRDVHLRLLSIDLDGEPGGLLAVQDVSALVAVEHTKDFLIRTLAHDMGSPLLVVGGALELLRDCTDVEGRKALLLEAENSMARLRAMHENLFGIARLQSTHLELALARQSPERLVAGVVDTARPLAREAGVALEGEAATRGLEVELDRELVLRALLNLVDNAIRFAPRGTSVRVRARQEGSDVLFEVADSGPGIPDGRRDSVFSPSVTTEDRLPGDPSGHRGLGLALVDLVAREHGGAASVECPTTGGSVFSLRLPLGRRVA